MLTASAPLDSSSQLPLEDQDSWPTSSNVLKTLRRVTVSAEKGYLVYISYSGHGVPEKRSGKSANQSGDLALVLFQNNEHSTSYFEGDTRAYCLERMNKQGLLVTIVLDYHFSGSILRTGAVRGVGIRSVDYVEATTPPDHQEHFGSHDKNCSLCIYTLSDDWLYDPIGL
ncbi:hypothetical protein CI102_3328 [Trichoderma harzianum]|uniref:Uncharacterized protein n=1 Tax=Trichoderma harzianum CBS 226.95 TaxID=983964 RepID=A0A2T4A185_TRIHA|nr:hypothetical protein M431DRAFT_511734 [Trichoderma harzianum CBS 226.95]PKK51670.1 hypothetical protein CI102_3328 [Trichoderma harzianum]PTB50825.1 hypothetical protein M431DRAFT_511734 [Trichoderma harzianum CBS 226.95]